MMNDSVEKANMTCSKLKMADGTEVGTLKELREHFDLISLLEHYSSGDLVKWLSVGYPEEAKSVESLQKNTRNENAYSVESLRRNTRNFEIKLCSILHLQVSLDDVIECYRQAAESGNAEGQYRLGKCYLSGRGKVGHAIEKNAQLGVEWLRKAGEQGHCDAQYLLSRGLYDNNVGIDEREAVKWMRKAAEQGHCGAQYELGDVYMRGRGVNIDEREAVKWLRKAAEQGHRVAQHDLGYAYMQGRGVGFDEREAEKWLRAYTGDNNEAMYLLGMAYQISEGEKAFHYYKNAAAHGYTDARLKLYCFFKDEEETIRWFREAAEKGDDEAAVILDGFEHMDDHEIDSIYWLGEGYWSDFGEKEAFHYYKIAANHGHTGAMCRLATFYMNGFAVEKDKEEAVRWFRKAAENGDGLASDVLENWENIEWNTL